MLPLADSQISAGTSAAVTTGLACLPLRCGGEGRLRRRLKKPKVEEDAPQPGAGRSGPIIVGEDGDYATLADAVANAPPGSEVVLRAGVLEGAEADRSGRGW